MRRILLVEDRPQRQISILGEDFVKSLEEKEGITLSNNLPDENGLDEFDLIIVHRSYLIENNLYQNLLELSKKKSKYVVSFSGGTSQTNLINEHFLETSAQNLYNKNRLESFVEEVTDTDNTIHLLELIYGKNWIVTLLVKYKHLVWQYEKNIPSNIDDEIYELEEDISHYYNVKGINMQFVDDKISQITQRL